MPKHTYPIIFILNPETEYFNGYIPDLAIFAEGKTPEEVYAEMEEILQNYMYLATKYHTEIPEPSSLEAITKKWPGFKVSLISATTKD
jgi:predicted RNase H-like HicB family nuclease